MVGDSTSSIDMEEEAWVVVIASSGVVKAVRKGQPIIVRLLPCTNCKPCLIGIACVIVCMPCRQMDHIWLPILFQDISGSCCISCLSFLSYAYVNLCRRRHSYIWWHSFLHHVLYFTPHTLHWRAMSLSQCVVRSVTILNFSFLPCHCFIVQTVKTVHLYHS